MNWEAIFWLIAMVIFMAAEAMTVSLVSIWFAVGALGAIIVALTGGGLAFQVTVFLTLAIVLLLSLRSVVRKRFTPRITRTNIDSIIGATGVVITPVNNIAARGQIQVNGVEWSARSSDNSHIPAGTLNGTVESFEYANGLVQTIMVKDAEGNLGRVCIDGYITTSYDVENLAVGCEITVTGRASYDNSFDGPAPRIRVRDRKDVVCSATPVVPEVKVIAEGWSGYTTWILTSDGVLTFTPSDQNLDGQTNLKNYWKVNGVLTLPWSAYAEMITTVVIEDGIHDIGQMAFYALPNLQSVTLGADIVEISNYAFKNCKSLTTINLENVDFIREGAFYGGSALENINFLDGVVIEDWAFSKTPYASFNP